MATTALTYRFGVADYVVFGSTIILSLAVGLYHAYHGRNQQTTESYLMGNRRLQMFPVALSLLVSFQSSILMLGYPAEVYVYGVMVSWTALALFFTFILGARILTPLFHPLKITSVFQYLEMRLKSRAPRHVGALLGMLYYLFYMGTVLYGPATALESVAGIPLWVSIVVVAIAAMIYTSLGGIKAVIWTDVFQLCIMLGGIILIIIKGCLVADGIDNVWHVNHINRRLHLFEFSPDFRVRQTIWNQLPASTFRYFGMVFNQATVQRVNTVKTQKEGKRMMLIAGFLFFVLGLLVVLQGLITYAYFNAVGCDPLESGQITNPNQLAPFMVIRMFKDLPGLSGLFIAALFSASLSTLSSGMNSMSAQLVEDFIKPHFKTMSDAKSTNIAKLSVIIFGLMAVSISFMVAEIQASLAQIYDSLLTCFSAPVAGIFLYSIFCPWATAKGAISGGLLSSIFVFWVSMGQSFSPTLKLQPWLPSNPTSNCFSNAPINETANHFLSNHSLDATLTLNFTSRQTAYDEKMEAFWESRYKASGLDRLYSLSYAWLGPVAILITIFIASMVSLVTGYPKPDEVDVCLLLPLGDTLFPYLPKRIRKLMEFGFNFHDRDKWVDATHSLEDVKLAVGNEETWMNATHPPEDVKLAVGNEETWANATHSPEYVKLAVGNEQTLANIKHSQEDIQLSVKNEETDEENNTDERDQLNT